MTALDILCGLVNAIAWGCSSARLTYAMYVRRRVGRIYWLGMAFLFGSLFATMQQDYWAGVRQRAPAALFALALILIDWWWGGPGGKRRRRELVTALKSLKPLAWGIPAKRPVPA